MSDDDVDVTFLPLPETFDFLNREDWQRLAQDIHNWFLTVPPASQQWTWGREAFWFAYVAAHPSFPHGRWPLWNPKIPLEGPFIEKWISRKFEPVVAKEPRQVLSQIWLEFLSHIALCHP